MRRLVTKAWSNGGASRALVFALVGSNPTPDRMSFMTTIFKRPFGQCPYGSMDRASDF